MPEVYQLKLSLRGVSLMLWRQLLVRSDMTLYQLHRAIQVLMNWDNYYLYQFKLFAWQFSSRAVSCEDDREILLEDFSLHLGERFLYEYNFFCFWQIDIRLEAVIPVEDKKTYPRCVAGEGDPPPEDIGGPVRNMDWLDDRYGFETVDAVYTLCEAVTPVLEALLEDGEKAFQIAQADFKANAESEDYDVALQRYRRSAWNRDDVFKRRTVNQQLKAAFAEA